VTRVHRYGNLERLVSKPQIPESDADVTNVVPLKRRDADKTDRRETDRQGGFQATKCAHDLLHPSQLQNKIKEVVCFALKRKERIEYRVCGSVSYQTSAMQSSDDIASARSKQLRAMSY
jgi:hypothetical protein